MATVSNWNFFNSNVQSGLLEGRYMNAAFTMLAAGPPRLSAIGTSVNTADENLGNLAWPIGVLQSVNLGRLPEHLARARLRCLQSARWASSLHEGQQ